MRLQALARLGDQGTDDYAGGKKRQEGDQVLLV
jgi:hypothetical protein